MEKSSEKNVGFFPNKYELAIVAAQEARRSNDILKRSNEEEKEKVTLKAIAKVSTGRVRYTYEHEEGRGE